MSTPIERIRELKTGAKNLRDRGARGYPRALSMLTEAIAIARDDLDRSTGAERRAQLANELSDCFGMVGGVERRWGDESEADERTLHLKAAIRAYDSGFAFESDSQYGIVDSYNRLNRLLVRLLVRPDALAADDVVVIDPEIPAVNLRREFEKASDFIRQQLTSVRRGNYWALADLALVEVLLGRSPAAVAYADFIALSPPDFAYVSALAGLLPLAKLPIPSAPSLGEAVALLEDRLGRLRS
jgi:hypothetical protein